MSHTIQHKKNLLHRVRRIRGQLEAVERALIEEEGCGKVMLTLAASRGAIHALMAELLEEHLRSHVPGTSDARERARATAEVVKAFRMSLR